LAAAIPDLVAWHLSMDHRHSGYGRKSESNERRFDDQAFATAIEPGSGELLHLAAEGLYGNVAMVGEQVMERPLRRYAEREQQEQKSGRIRSYTMYYVHVFATMLQI
jgi:hypothetical protein